MTDPHYPCLVTFVFTSNISYSTISLKKKWLLLITEKRVEIWHSVMWSIIQVYDKAAEIRAKATSFAASKSKQRIHTNFTTPYSRGFSTITSVLLQEKPGKIEAGRYYK